MALPPVVQPCIDRAVLRAGSLVAHAGSAALDSLLQVANSRDAAREMQMRLPGWRTRYGELLQRAIDNPPPPATELPRPKGSSLELQIASMSLVDEDAVAQSIESTRFAEQLKSRLEKPLAELDALVSSALGLEGIRPEANPIRPEVFAQALGRMLGEDQPHPDWPGLWLRAMADAIALDLAQLYAECTALLLKAGVQAAGWRVVNKEGRPARPAPPRVSAAARASAPSDPVFAQAVGTWMKSPVQALRGPFVRDFLARDAAQMHEPLPASYQMEVHRELAALRARDDEPGFDVARDHEHEPLPPVDRQPRIVASDTPLTQAAWGRFAAPRQRALVRLQLKADAQELGQVLGVDLVRKLLDQVAMDPRLLPPVREAMVALEPALGRLAMQAPRFFGTAGNPARQLLEQVALRSFRYNDQFAAEFGEFFDGVREKFNALNDDEALSDAQPFEEALAELQAAWTAQDQHAEAHKQALLAAVQAAERRQAEADVIAKELAQRSDLAGVPGVVQDFLFERWSLVVAHARAATENRQVDPGGYIAVITDLLWSVKRELALRDPAKAFETILRVVSKLRDGLIRIGQPPGDDDVFFKALERLHRPVMKLRAKHRQQAMESTPETEGEDLKPSAAQKPREAEDVWLAPGELRACGFEDTVLADVAAHRKTLGKGAPQITQEDADKLIARLAPGAWVDLYSRRTWRRAQLTWASHKGTLFMFVSQGGRPHSMTRRSLQRLMAARLVRTVDRHEVVQRAIDVLARPQPGSQQMAA